MAQFRKESLFKSTGFHTFFIPIDEGFTTNRLQLFDAEVIDAHVIPNHVYFTRPTPKDTPYDTLADGDYLYVIAMFSAINGKLFVKSHTINGDSNHPIGEIAAEVVHANIPVRNGVVHLIKRPLVVFDRSLTLFPYLPILNKIATDPTLNITYTLGENSEFNSLLEDEIPHLTFFVPTDKAWRKLKDSLASRNISFDDFVTSNAKNILRRHLVVSNVTYPMRKLLKMVKDPDTADVCLNTPSGELWIGVGEIDSGYVIYWKDKFVTVYRADYQCTNGIVHLVDDIFISEAEVKKDSPILRSLDVLNIIIRLTGV